jgi:hypothetical protein
LSGRARAEDQVAQEIRSRAVAQIEDSGPPRLEFFWPFGPMIARTETSRALVDRINAYADRELHPGQGAEFLLPQELALDGGAGSLARKIERLIARYVRRLEGAARIRVRIDAFWIVSQYSVRVGALGIEGRFRQHLFAEAQRKKRQAPKMQEITGKRAERSQIPANGGERLGEQEKVVMTSVADVDEILDRVPTELDHARALEANIENHERLDTCKARMVAAQTAFSGIFGNQVKER